jgi:hypothetical protein
MNKDETAYHEAGHAVEASGYEKISRLAKERGRNIPDLLALARKNDPYFVGSSAQMRQAVWFASLWERFGYTTGVHIRRVHYQLVSQESPEDFDGKPYRTRWRRCRPTCRGCRRATLAKVRSQLAGCSTADATTSSSSGSTSGTRVGRKHDGKDQDGGPLRPRLH